MLSKGFKIVSPKTFEIYYEDVNIAKGEALVKINMAAICKADLRYYLGLRDEKTLGLKYPMRLIHEAVGTIIKDPTNTFRTGETVVLVPNITSCNIGSDKGSSVDETCSLGEIIGRCKLNHRHLGENYCPKAKFASSNMDGFSCEYLSFPVTNLVKVSPKVSKEVAVFSELTSVAMAASRKIKNLDNKVIGIWGDGIVGYILTAVLKNLTNSKVIIVGKNPDKLSKFTADEAYKTGDSYIRNIGIDIAFECVGGKGSESAINEIIDNINIGGEIVLAGVSEKNVEINTRKILEKGLLITGTTRSSVEDFKKSVELMEADTYSKAIETLIKEIKQIRDISNYYDVFEAEVKNTSLEKTVMKFSI
ncbi:MAG: alcohol dehydrogenase catalytic domain-containing protein [Clostridium sp.]|uniref:zinc-binding dehydrogenase n=1 Tax=Clostridium sp. TaxID=1506 RepID=UPI0032172333